MRDENKAIRWRLKVGDTEFTIFDKEGEKFNLTHGLNRVVIDTYGTPEEAAAALQKIARIPKWRHLFNGDAIPAELSAWTPELRASNVDIS